MKSILVLTTTKAEADVLQARGITARRYVGDDDADTLKAVKDRTVLIVTDKRRDECAAVRISHWLWYVGVESVVCPHRVDGDYPEWLAQKKLCNGSCRSVSYRVVAAPAVTQERLPICWEWFDGVPVLLKRSFDLAVERMRLVQARFFLKELREAGVSVQVEAGELRLRGLEKVPCRRQLLLRDLRDLLIKLLVT